MAEVFSDSLDRVWQVNVTPYEQQLVLSQANANLYDIVDEKLAGEFVDKLETDDIFLIDIMYAICMDQADEKEITKSEFQKGFSGEVISKAYLTLLKALSVFFRNPVHRLAMSRMVEALGKITEASSRKQDQLVNAACNRIIEQQLTEIKNLDVDSEVEKLLASALNGRANSEST